MHFYKNKTVWIIGGTSGIGLAIAQKLSSVKDCSVIISGRDTSKAGEINARKIPLDVVDRQSFTDAVENILALHAKVDIIKRSIILNFELYSFFLNFCLN